MNTIIGRFVNASDLKRFVHAMRNYYIIVTQIRPKEEALEKVRASALLERNVLIATSDHHCDTCSRIPACVVNCYTMDRVRSPSLTDLLNRF